MAGDMEIFSCLFCSVGRFRLQGIHAGFSLLGLLYSKKLSDNNLTLIIRTRLNECPLRFFS